ncbi:hypothetical protein ACIHCX_00015 [Streptomyces sp. NPDC052043]|uniref:hypothetical protein n=1 Tax=Streptomyces sp. NPDC052043 TaxID=3365684 RepID=UPI0037D71320
MKTPESHITVAIVEAPDSDPNEVWDLGFWQLDMFTEEVIAELETIAWAEGNEYPNNYSVGARSGRLNWGASGSFSEIILQVGTGTAAGVGAPAITAAIKSVYQKLKKRAQRESLESAPTIEDAEQLAKARIHEHYHVAMDRLTVIRSEIATESHRYDFEFSSEDGRKFGATVGAIEGISSCTRIWSEGNQP